MPKKKAQVATSEPSSPSPTPCSPTPKPSYHDLGTDYYEQRSDTRRQARNHVRSLERLGYKVTIEAIDPRPETGNLPITKAS